MKRERGWRLQCLSFLRWTTPFLCDVLCWRGNCLKVSLLKVFHKVQQTFLSSEDFMFPSDVLCDILPWSILCICSFLYVSCVYIKRHDWIHPTIFFVLFTVSLSCVLLFSCQSGGSSGIEAERWVLVPHHCSPPAQITENKPVHQCYIYMSCMHSGWNPSNAPLLSMGRSERRVQPHLFVQCWTKAC